MQRRSFALLVVVLTVLAVGLAVPAVACATAEAGASWSWQRPGLQGDTVLDAQYADASNIWAVADAGTLLHSADGGATWVTKSFGKERPLVDLSFVDKYHGWAIGDASVYRTSDGGVTWTAYETFKAGTHLMAGSFADAKNGWVVGFVLTDVASSGIVYRTSDGGVSWQQQMTGSAEYWRVVDFISATDGWILGGDGVGLHTVDGGAKWTRGDFWDDGPAYIHDIAFAGVTGVCMIEDTGTIICSSDGGDTWELSDYESIPSTSVAPYRLHFRGMDGWNVRVNALGPYKNELWHSADGGMNWSYVGQVPYCDDVAFTDATHGVAFGSGGYLLQTTDGGATWTPRLGAPEADVLAATTFLDRDNGWAVGSKGAICTTDSGATWVPRNNGIPSSTLLDGVHFADMLNGWVVGTSGKILRTTDGGTTWTVQASGTSKALADVTFLGLTNGWAVGEDSTILHTTDGGGSWHSQIDTSGIPAMLTAVAFTDANRGVAVGYVRSDFPTETEGVTQGVILRTTDGGTSWSRQGTPRTVAFEDVHFVDATHGFAVGVGDVRMMYTADGGATWTIRYPGVPEYGPYGPYWYRHDLYAIDFADAKNGWAVGAYGTVVHTTDGGQTWLPQPSVTNNLLLGIAAPDGEHAWAVGEYSTILTAGGAAQISPVSPVGKPTASIAGATRIGTAIECARAAFSSADTVVIATAWNFPDALGGASLAGASNAPLLLTDKDALPGAVADEIERLGAKDAIILGGTPAVGSGVESQLASLLGGSSHVKRIGGADRYATAALVAAETLKALQAGGRTFDGTVFVATGDNFPDALAASPLAAAKGWPILLTRPGGLPAATSDALTSLGATKAVMLGGENVVSASVASQLGTKVGATNVSRLAGADRYLTACEIAKFGAAHGMGYMKLAIATGENYPDALAGGVMAGRFNSMMLLTPKASLYPDVATLISANKASIEKVYYLGSTAAVSQGVRDAVANVLR